MRELVLVGNSIAVGVGAGQRDADGDHPGRALVRGLNEDRPTRNGLHQPITRHRGNRRIADGVLREGVAGGHILRRVVAIAGDDRERRRLAGHRQRRCLRGQRERRGNRRRLTELDRRKIHDAVGRHREWIRLAGNRLAANKAGDTRADGSEVRGHVRQHPRAVRILRHRSVQDAHRAVRSALCHRRRRERQHHCRDKRRYAPHEDRRRPVAHRALRVQGFCA